MKRKITEEFSIEEAFKALNMNPKAKTSKKQIRESLNESDNAGKHLESIDVVIDDYDEITSEDLANYAANPIIRKYAQKNIFDKIATSDAILEMTSEDFGDGEGDPKGYIFAKDGNVSYIVLSSNAYDYVPNISFDDFKNIIEGKDLFWNEIGFGDFSDTAHYIFDPIESVEDIISECDEQSEVYLWNLDNLADLDESLNESTPVIPTPYDKYFTVSDYDPDEFAGEYLVGDTIENYDSKLLAYLEVKPEYEELFDGWALLVDDPEFPVVELAGGRMYPLDVKSVFEEALTESNSNFMDDVE